MQADKLQSGNIIRYGPRRHMYQVLYRSKLKTPEGWVDAVAYQQHNLFGAVWTPGPDLTVYVRPVEMFSENWTLYK